MRRSVGLFLVLAGCSSTVAGDGGVADAGGDGPPLTPEFRLGGTYNVNLLWTAGPGACASVMEAETDEVIVNATEVILRRGNDNFPDPCPLYLTRVGTNVDAGMGGLQVHATGMVGTCTFHFGAPADAMAANATIQLMNADVVLQRTADGFGSATMTFTWSIPMGMAVCGNGGAGGTLTETTNLGP